MRVNNFINYSRKQKSGYLDIRNAIKVSFNVISFVE